MGTFRTLRQWPVSRLCWTCRLASRSGVGSTTIPRRDSGVSPLLLGAGRDVKHGGSSDPYAAYLLYDSFTEPSDTALASHVPEKDVVGGGWTEIGGNWTVRGATDDLVCDAV